MRHSKIDFRPISGAIANTYPKKNLDKEAPQIFRDFQDAGIVIDTEILASLVAACMDADLQGKAEKLLEEAVRQLILVPTLGFDSQTYTLDLRRGAIEVNPSSKRKRKAIVSSALGMALFKYHKARAEKIEGVFVEREVNGRTRAAIAQCMRDSGVAPVRSVNPDRPRDARLECGWTVVRRCMEKGMADIALKVFEEMMKQDLAICSALIPQCHEHLPADQASEVCSVFISVCAKRGQIVDALGAFRQMVGKGYYPSALACTDLILACGTARRLDYADEVFNTARSSGLRTEKSLYRTMIKTCEQGEWPEVAVRAFDVMMAQPNMQDDADSYFAAIAACRQVENLQGRCADLITEAIKNSAFDPTLGYVPGTPGASGHTLRFSADAIAAKAVAEPRGPLPPFFVQAVIERHRFDGRIEAGTRFIIPSHDKTAEVEIGRLLRSTHRELTLTLEEDSPDSRHLVLSSARPVAQQVGTPMW